MKFINFFPAIIWFIFINILLLMPGSDLPQSPFFELVYFDKWVHIGLLGILTFLISFPFLRVYPHPQKLFFIIMLACILYGILIEYMQKYFTADRAFDIYDMVADSVGCTLAFFFLKWLKRGKYFLKTEEAKGI